MDDKDIQKNPWDSGFYETGSTKPPKNNGGLLAIMLVGGIFLGGILNSLGVFRVEFGKGKGNPGENQNVISLVDSSGTSEETLPREPERIPASQNVETLKLHESPRGKPNIAPEGGLPLQDIYEKTADSVVSITCTLADGTATGSGVILTEDGYLVTNAHVVENADSVSVLLANGNTRSAWIVGQDALSDLAVLKISGEDLVPAEFGDSSALRVGDTVAAIGDPLGIELRGTMTDGIVSALNRVITTGGRSMTLIQTNAALNSGNSGGPLINCYGQVVGINTMKISRFVSTSASVEGIGFAIPSTTVKEIVDQLIAQGYVSGRPDLGVDVSTMSAFNQRFYHLPAGLYVYGTREGSETFQVGDIILTVDGKRLYTEDDLQGALYSHQVGETVEVVFQRGGRQYSAEAVLAQAR